MPEAAVWMPPEWQPQDWIWIGFPHDAVEWPGFLERAQEQIAAFANAVAFLAEQHDHHPDMLLGFKSCSVRWRTHDVHGVSVTDFACAALTDALLQANGQEGHALG